MSNVGSIFVMAFVAVAALFAVIKGASAYQEHRQEQRRGRRRGNLSEHSGGNWNDNDDDDDLTRNWMCPVCLSTYKDIMGKGQRIVVINCGHVFCDRCIKDCLKLKSICPCCNQNATQEDIKPLYFG